MSRSMDLARQGKLAITTGDPKRIGRSISEAFLQEDAPVAICARDETTPAYAAAAKTGRLDILTPNSSAISADFRVILSMDGAATTSLLRQP